MHDLQSKGRRRDKLALSRLLGSYPETGLWEMQTEASFGSETIARENQCASCVPEFKRPRQERTAYCRSVEHQTNTTLRFPCVPPVCCSRTFDTVRHPTPAPDIQSQTEGYAIFIPLRPPPGGRPSAGARTDVSDCAGFAPNLTKSGLSLTALSLTPCHPPESFVLSCSPFRSVFFGCRSSEQQKQPEPAERELND